MLMLFRTSEASWVILSLGVLSDDDLPIPIDLEGSFNIAFRFISDWTEPLGVLIPE